MKSHRYRSIFKRFADRLSRRPNSAFKKFQLVGLEPLETRALLTASPAADYQDAAGQLDEMPSMRQLLSSCTSTSQGASAYTSTADTSDSDGPSATPMVDTQIAQIRLEVENMSNQSIDTIKVGQDFKLAVFVKDIRDPANSFPGLWAAFLNVTYDSGLASITSIPNPNPGTDPNDLGNNADLAFEFGPYFNTGLRTGDLDTGGQIAGAGSSSLRSSGSGISDVLLWRVTVHASAAGTLEFTPSFDNTTDHETSFINPTDPLTSGQINFLSDQLDILAPTISVSTATAAEANAGTTPFVFTVSLSESPTVPITVNYSATNGTATLADNDFVATSGSLSFAVGEQSKLVTVLVNGDNKNEANETFTLSLSNAVNGAIGTLGVGTINNDDPVPTVSLSPPSKAEGDSGSSPLVFTATLSAVSGQAVTVAYATSNGSATTGDNDYTATSGTLTFTAGTTSQLITVSVQGDTKNEADENFTVSLSNPTNATVATATALGTITNDDPVPVISVVGQTKFEGNEGDTPFVFTLTLSAVSGQQVTVAYENDGDGDWDPFQGVVTFAPGTTQQLVTVMVHGDTVVEPNETFDLGLAAPVNATISSQPGGSVILNDDGPYISFVSNSVTHAEGNSSQTVYVFDVTIHNPAGDTPVTVVYTTQNGTATSADGDYTPTSGTLTFTGETLTQQITVLVNGDTKREVDETFSLVLSSPTGASLAESVATGTVTNDDPIPVVSIEGVSDDEGNAGSKTFLFTVTLSNASDAPISVAYATNDGTAKTGDSDYTATSGSLTFAPGTTQQIITISVSGDAKNEADETFSVLLSNVTNANLDESADSGVGTILNDDPLPALTVGAKSQAEGNSGTSTMVFTVSLSAVSGQDVTVRYATADGTATISGSNDYAATSGTLTFLAGTTQQLVTVTINGDTKHEGDETFSLNLTQPVNATVTGNGSTTGTITNDDAAPVISASDVLLPEGDAGTKAFVFTVTLSAASEQQVTVQYATADGTATTAGSDYAATSGTLTFAPNTTSQLVTVLVNGDASNEPDEKFTLHLSNATVGTLNATSDGEGTIANDDGPLLSFSQPDITQTEGNSGTVNVVYTVKLSTPSTSVVTVQFATQDGTATTAGNDYGGTSGTLTFTAGTTQQLITVVVNGDTLNEDNETFTLDLFNSTNAGNAGSVNTKVTGSGTISNDDAVPTLSIAGNSVTEGDSGSQPLVLTVKLSAASGKTVTVPFFTSDRTDNNAATPGTDYVATSGTLTFAPGSTQQLITVLVNGDTLNELNEGFFVNLDSNNAVNATVATAQVTGGIGDNDPIPTLSIGGGGTINEGNSGQTLYTYTVALSAASGKTVTVNYSTVDGTATTTGDDYIGQSGILTFAPGQTTQTFAVAANGDLRNEADETFNVTLSAPSNATIVTGTAQGLILNDDAKPTISITDVSQAEGDSGKSNFVFQVSLSEISGQQVTVVYATANGTATTSNSDYTATSGTLTFAPGVKTLNVTVQVTGDKFDEGNETFFVNLTSPNANATIADAQGQATIQDETTDDQTFALSSISGFAFVDADAGNDRDAGEMKLKGISVRITGASDVSETVVDKTVVTDENGFYQFTGLEPATYLVTFSKLPGWDIGHAIENSAALEALPNDGKEAGFTATIPQTGGLTLTEANDAVAGMSPGSISMRIFQSSEYGTGNKSTAQSSALASALAARSEGAAAPEITQDGGVITVHGTDGDDVFEFQGGTDFYTINGVVHHFDPAAIQQVIFEGGAGHDTASLTGSAGDDVAELGLGSGTLSGTGYRVTVNNVKGLVVEGGGGNDTATLHDSALSDRLNAEDDTLTLANDLDQVTTLIAFDHVLANSSNGGTDTATVGAIDFNLERQGGW